MDVDRAEAQLNGLIERRAHEAKVANEEAAAWQESARKYRARLEFERREAWRAYFLRQAEIHSCLAEQNRLKAVRLVGRGGDPMRARRPHAQGGGGA